MGIGLHVGIDAQGNARFAAETMRQRVDQRELRLGFAVEVMNARGQRFADFRGGFADARKNDLRRIASGPEDAEQFAAGDDIEARAFGCQQAQHGEISVGLDRVADRVRLLPERLIVGAEILTNRGGGIDVAGSPGAGGNFRERHSIAVERALRVVECMHRERFRLEKTDSSS